MEGTPPLPSYTHGASTIALLGQTIGDNLRDTVNRFPDRDALVVCSQKVRLTYRQLFDETTRVARGLLALGVKPGERVGIWASNRYEWVVIQYATARIGAILVNINPAYLANELEYVVRQSGVSLLLHADSFRQNRYEPMLAGITQDNCPQLRRKLHLDRDYDALRQRGEDVSLAELEAVERTLDFDDPINIQYTSGTTGFPKGATLTHHNILNNGYLTARSLGYTEADRVCIPVPFYHCFGMVLGNLACTPTGACMVVPGNWFDPAATLAAVAAEACTSLYGVPTMFRALLEDPAFPGTNCSSLRTGIMAGAPCPVELMRQVVTRLHMPQVAIAYGMTETSPLSTISALDDPLEKRVGTVGRVMPHNEITIRDRDSGRIVPRGTAGEFCTRGYSVMRGYWQDEAATRASIDAGGWMHSGDLAVMEPDGYVHIVGRLKDMIIRGGENISPREIEEVLHTHPAVAEAQVIGVPSAKYGEEVMAWVRLGAGEKMEPATLESFCRARLASYKLPRYWQFVESFPMTVTGKIQKYRLRQMAVELLGREAEAAEKTA
jgi:fatty-acyl-CoA synthase